MAKPKVVEHIEKEIYAAEKRHGANFGGAARVAMFNLALKTYTLGFRTGKSRQKINLSSLDHKVVIATDDKVSVDGVIVHGARYCGFAGWGPIGEVTLNLPSGTIVLRNCTVERKP